MDAPDTDFDVKLQKMSGELIADLDRALTTTLRRPDGNGGTRVRSFIRAREIFRSTTEVLDLFQELPQLLDPHLSKWIPLLAESYLEWSQKRRHRLRRIPRQPDHLVSVDYAICRILYAFCKVRGEKVIVRFLNVEAKYLEILLSAVEESEEDEQVAWEWEQRYVVLLWLSHLLLAPFDLSTMSTWDVDEASAVAVPGLQWPRGLPGIALRILPLAIKYLSSPGKEKDAAVALLARLALRRDMQKLGLLQALIRWAVDCLRPRKDEPLKSTYFYFGVLSFLAGTLKSAAETSEMDSFLVVIFGCAHGITLRDNDLSESMYQLAIVRRIVLKIIRSVAVALLRQPRQSPAATDMVETSIGYFLDSVSDNDTTVRLSASKCLSVITLRLDPGMASQVVEAALEALNRNVLWNKAGEPSRNLSAVNSLEWHGLMLTLAHLLYRRSPPADQLSDMIHALLLGLSFEQRSTSGGSVGANVRDAACFGVWALARRYSTPELLGVSTTSVFAADAHRAASSVLQVLATELVVTASLDPSGNIRRGASAALQELIGRHPDVVERGIEVVQSVDYQAVARRSRAVDEVARKATKLSAQYGEALVGGVLGWRGVGDVDAPSRRVAGAAFGVLTAELASLDADAESPLSRFRSAFELVTRRVQSLVKRQVEELHGMLLCLASVLDQISAAVAQTRGSLRVDASLRYNILASVADILDECRLTHHRRPELVAEGASHLVVSVLPALQASVCRQDGASFSLGSGRQLLSMTRVRAYTSFVSQQVFDGYAAQDVARFMSSLQATLPAWLSRNEPEVVEPASAAAVLFLTFSSQQSRLSFLQEWAGLVAKNPSSSSSKTLKTGKGYFHAVAMAQPMASLPQGGPGNDMACQSLLDRWAKDNDVDVRVTILQSLVRSDLLRAAPKAFADLLIDGLNDYTTNARGDVGSHVRVQALLAVKALWGPDEGPDGEARVAHDVAKETTAKAFSCVLRLAAEKLDRVRVVAQAVVALMMRDNEAKAFLALSCSSRVYFHTLLSLTSCSDSLSDSVLEAAPIDNKSTWTCDLLAGFVTSADTGNDDLVIASRAALTDFCQASREHLDLACTSLVQNLRTFQGDDRIAVPTLEIIAFLYHVGLFPDSREVNPRSLCLYAQKAGYKTGNVRKLVACAKVYGGIAGHGCGGADEAEADAHAHAHAHADVDATSTSTSMQAGVKEARKRLGALLFHPWPRVRSAVVDEIWGLAGFQEGSGGAKLTSVDWSVATREQVGVAVQALGLA